MIADRAMAELEAATLEGGVPETTEDQSEEGQFTVVVTVAPFSLGGARANQQASGQEEGAPADLRQLIAREIPGQASHLRALNVRVAWMEAGAEYVVARTSFAYDLVKASEAYDGQSIEDDDQDSSDDADDAARGGRDTPTGADVQ